MQNQKLKVIDLFSGAGGFSKGFEMAGFDILLGIDYWEDALKTYKYNHNNCEVINDNIYNINKKDIMSVIERNIEEIDVVIGGPPCQGFSISGKRDENDHRNDLIYEYLRLISQIKPKYFVMENVEGLKSMNRGEYLKKLIYGFNEIDYKVKYKVLDSANYGVPQKRRRIFLIGNRINKNNYFPIKEYGKNEKKDLFNGDFLKDFITMREATSDLPSLENDLNLEGKPLNYATPPKNEYQKMMRKKSSKIYNHQGTKHWDKTINMIKHVPEGGNWKDIPEKIRNEEKFNARYTRLDGNKPSITIDTGHRHHFHYKENRVPTVREKARLQSFPDDFIFKGSKTSQNTQVGNAVPCILAKKIAELIKNEIK